MKRTVVIFYNWETEETLHTAFEGDGCALKAEAFMRSIEKDFPESKGWAHIVHWNDEAGEERGRQFVDMYFKQGG